MCLFSLYFVKYIIVITRNAQWKNWSHFCKLFLLRKYDFRRRWSATPKNRGQSKKTEEGITLKSRGSSLSFGSYLQRGSAPPPLPTSCQDSPQPHPLEWGLGPIVQNTAWEFPAPWPYNIPQPLGSLRGH